MANENTYKNMPAEQKEQAVRSEMLPFAIYAAIPIAITIAIAFIFGPSLT
jgi:hypothetical protein